METISSVTPVKILLIEDNPGDADLARDALENGKIKTDFHVVGNLTIVVPPNGSTG